MTELWFHRVSGMDTETMREIAREADVSWDPQAVVYAKRGIGYADGDRADAEAIREAAQTVLGIKPVQIDNPRNDDTDTTTE